MLNFPQKRHLLNIPEFIYDGSKRSNTNSCCYTHTDVVPPNILSKKSREKVAGLTTWRASKNVWMSSQIINEHFIYLLKYCYTVTIFSFFYRDIDNWRASEDVQRWLKRIAREFREYATPNFHVLSNSFLSYHPSLAQTNCANIHTEIMNTVNSRLADPCGHLVHHYGHPDNTDSS